MTQTELAQRLYIEFCGRDKDKPGLHSWYDLFISAAQQAIKAAQIFEQELVKKQTNGRLTNGGDG